MTEYDKIEELLESYTHIKAGIRAKELQLEELTTIRSATIDDMPKAYNRISSSTENYVTRKKDLEFEIGILTNKKESIENLLCILKDDERLFIRLRYFESRTYKEISSKLDLSPEYLPSKRIYILDKLIPFTIKYNLI